MTKTWWRTFLVHSVHNRRAKIMNVPLKQIQVTVYNTEHALQQKQM